VMGCSLGHGRLKGEIGVDECGSVGREEGEWTWAAVGKYWEGYMDETTSSVC